jgi:hypothetical protein
MDFSTLKNINLSLLQRTELGEDYREVFQNIYQIFQRVNDLLLAFESVYENLIYLDRQKIDNIFNTYNNFVAKTRTFKIEKGETVDQGIQRATNLLAEISNFYTEILPTISQLQIYVREDLKRNLTEQSSSLRNEIQNRINEISNANSSQRTDVQNLVNQVNKTLQTQIENIDRQNTSQQELLNNFINNARNSLDPKLTELTDKLEVVQKITDDVSKVKTDVEELSKVTSDYSVDSITKEYGSIFESRASKNFVTATLFGSFFLAGMAISIASVYKLFLPLVEQFGWQFAVPASFSLSIEYYILTLGVRLTILFLILWVLRELLKNYNSNMHLYTLNMHRSSSLKSFEIIVKHNILRENRDDIAKQIAQTIFSNQEDGYLTQKKDEIPLNDIANLIGVLRK